MTFTPPERRIARVLRTLLAREAFDSIGNLKEALKRRCAALHLEYDAEVINDALDLVESNRQLVSPKPRQPVTRSIEGSPFRTIRRDEAAVIWKRWHGGEKA